MLRKHYEIRKKAPQLFAYRDATSEDVKKSFKYQQFAIFPPTQDDIIVCFYALHDTQPKNFDYVPSTATFMWMIGKKILLLTKVKKQ